MAPKIKIIYFNGRGRGEMLRWICEVGGLEYENVRLTREEWAAVKPDAPFGQLPMIEYDGVKLAQSKAINRFLARKAGLAGNDDLEQCQVDMYLELLTDLFDNWIKVAFEKDEERKKEVQKTFEEEKFPNFAKTCNKKLEQAGGKYFVGNHLTLADLEIASFLKSFIDPTDPATSKYLPTLQEYRTSGVLKDYPLLAQHIDTVCNEPKLKAWLEKRPKNEEETF